MFKLSKGVKKVWWPLMIQVPVDGGKSAQHKIEVQYEVLPQSEVDAVVNDSAAFFERTLCDWRMVADDDGNAMECNDENKAAMFDVPYVRSAILTGYFEAAAGGRRKN
mgnify:CR=1 FL=1